MLTVQLAMERAKTMGGRIGLLCVQLLGLRQRAAASYAPAFWRHSPYNNGDHNECGHCQCAATKP